MRPFQAPFPNQIRPEGQPNTSALQQITMSNPNNMCNNHDPCHSTNPHFPIQPNNPNFMNVAANPYQQLHLQNIQMGLLPQGQFFPQNVLSQLQAQLLQNNLQGQFFGNNHPQGANMPNGQFNFNQFPQHINPVTGLPHGQFPQQHIGFPQVSPFNIPPCMPHSMGCGNQGTQAQGPQNLGFHMNPQSGMVNSHQVTHNALGQNMFIPSTMGQNALQESPIGGQHLQRNSLPSINSGQAQMQQTQNNSQADILGKAQGNHAKDNGSNISNINQRNPQGNNVIRNQQESGKKDSRNTRFQKNSFHPMTNAKGNFNSFKGKGPDNKGARNHHLTKCTKQETSVESKSSKPLPLNYTDEEIQKWREERKKNHPSRSIEKKFEDQTYSEVIDNAAQKHRQQLKEILAKQAELGVEVAEIPRDYLLDSGSQVNETEQNKTFTERGRFKKRGGRRCGGNNRFNKKQKFGDNDSSPGPAPAPAPTKKIPTLLQKLLSADIKRDKSHLLQALRFMVLNSFFVDHPKKPLEFPSVTVKDMGSANVAGREASPHQVNRGISVVSEKNTVKEFDTLQEDVADVEDEVINVQETNSIIEEDSEGEEGELTD